MKAIISLDSFILFTVGEIYCLAPYHKPRFIDEIVDEIIKRFKENCERVAIDFYYYEMELDDLPKFVEKILMSIDKFRELNLSPKEYKQGVRVDDENRKGFVFFTAFSNAPEEDNFVDLDACIRNISWRWRKYIEAEEKEERK